MNLASGVRVTLRQPVPPRVTVTQLSSARSVVVPVRGPQGPPGAAGGAVYAHHQTTPAATWSISHNLGARRAPVIVLDDAPNRVVHTDTDLLDVNTTVLTFPTPVTGWAYFN